MTWIRKHLLKYDTKNTRDKRKHTEAVVFVQSPSHVRLSATPWTVACRAPLFLTISYSLPTFMSTSGT